MCPTMTTSSARANQSWTKVAPVRQASGNGSNHRMIAPVASISGMQPATKMALSFWPALNLPMRALPRRPRLEQPAAVVDRPPGQAADVAADLVRQRPA